MDASHATLSLKSAKLLGTISEALHRPPEQVLDEALAAYAQQMNLDDDAALPPDWKEAVAGIAGLWKDRDDLPDFDDLRRSWDRNVWGDRSQEPPE
jgi:hypothetical protein